MKLRDRFCHGGVVSARAARIVVCGALGASIVIAAAGCTDNASSAAKNKGPGKDAVPVVAAMVTQKSMPVRIQAIGNVEPYSTVSVKSRVDGQIVRVHFTEGQDVAKGQLLFEIDPRPFEAQLKQAQANLMRDKAQLGNAGAQERRYQDLLQKNFVSKEFYAQVRTNLEAAEAAVYADEAAVENAYLQIEYSRIRSPLDGRTGKIMVQEGNLVKANDTAALVVINQVKPIYVTLSVPEQFLGMIRSYMASGPLQVEVSPQDAASQQPVSGELSFVDNAVDATTGTIKLKAIFQNRDKVLWPGQFGTAALTLHHQWDAIVVPSQAVQTGPKGRYVFVVRPDLTVVDARGCRGAGRGSRNGDFQGRLSRGEGGDKRPVEAYARRQSKYSGPG